MRRRTAGRGQLYNPVDGSAMRTYQVRAGAQCSDDPGSTVLVMVAPTDFLTTEVASMLATYAGRTEIPIVAPAEGGMVPSILREGIPNYESPDRR